MKIACISDLHLSGIINDNTDLINDFFFYLQDFAINHLLICGDVVGTLSDPSVSEDFDELRKTLKHYNLYDSQKCTIVPGNHDARWMGNFEAAKARTIRQVYPSLFRADQKYNKTRYIITKMLRSCAIIGLDTATDNGPGSFHTGLLDQVQLNELERLQSLQSIKERHVIVAMHHVPQSHDIIEGVLKDADQFWDVVDPDVVDLIICGHIHESQEYEDFDVPVVCVGGFTKDEECLVIDINKQDFEWDWLNVWE